MMATRAVSTVRQATSRGRRRRRRGQTTRRRSRRSGRPRGGPGRGRSSAGSSVAQISCAFQHRVRNRQPLGGSTGLGTSPSSTMRLRSRSRFGLGHGHRREQRLRVRVAGLAVDLVGDADLDDLAEVHHRDRVGDVAHHREVVRDEQVREPEPLLQVLEQVHDAGLDRHVERRHRLVEHEQRRVERERPGDADALALTARELVRVAVARAPGSARRARSSSSTRAR